MSAPTSTVNNGNRQPRPWHERRFPDTLAGIKDYRNYLKNLDPSECEQALLNRFTHFFVVGGQRLQKCDLAAESDKAKFYIEDEAMASYLAQQYLNKRRDAVKKLFPNQQFQTMFHSGITTDAAKIGWAATDKNWTAGNSGYNGGFQLFMDYLKDLDLTAAKFSTRGIAASSQIQPASAQPTMADSNPVDRADTDSGRTDVPTKTDILKEDSEPQTTSGQSSLAKIDSIKSTPAESPLLQHGAQPTVVDQKDEQNMTGFFGDNSTAPQGQLHNAEPVKADKNDSTMTDSTSSSEVAMSEISDFDSGPRDHLNGNQPEEVTKGDDTMENVPVQHQPSTAGFDGFTVPSEAPSEVVQLVDVNKQNSPAPLLNVTAPAIANTPGITKPSTSSNVFNFAPVNGTEAVKPKHSSFKFTKEDFEDLNLHLPIPNSADTSAVQISKEVSQTLEPGEIPQDDDGQGDGGDRSGNDGNDEDEDDDDDEKDIDGDNGSDSDGDDESDNDSNDDRDDDSENEDSDDEDDPEDYLEFKSQKRPNLKTLSETTKPLDANSEAYEPTLVKALGQMNSIVKHSAFKDKLLLHKTQVTFASSFLSEKTLAKVEAEGKTIEGFSPEDMKAMYENRFKDIVQEVTQYAQAKDFARFNSFLGQHFDGYPKWTPAPAGRSIKPLSKYGAKKFNGTGALLAGPPTKKLGVFDRFLAGSSAQGQPFDATKDAHQKPGPMMSFEFPWTKPAGPASVPKGRSEVVQPIEGPKEPYPILEHSPRPTTVKPKLDGSDNLPEVRPVDVKQAEADNPYGLPACTPAEQSIGSRGLDVSQAIDEGQPTASKEADAIKESLPEAEEAVGSELVKTAQDGLKLQDQAQSNGADRADGLKKDVTEPKAKVCNGDCETATKLHEANEELQEGLATSNGRIDDLEEELDTLKRSNTELQKAANDRTEIDKANKDLKATNEAKETLGKEIEVLKARNTELGEIEKERNSLKLRNAQLEEVKKERDTLKTRNERLEQTATELEAIKAENVKLEKAAAELEAVKTENVKLEKAAEERDALKTQNAKLKQAATDSAKIEETKKKLQAELEGHKITIRAHENNHRANQETFEQMSAANTDLHTKINKVMDEHETLVKQKKALRKELKIERKGKTEITKDREATKAKLTNLENAAKIESKNPTDTSSQPINKGQLAVVKHTVTPKTRRPELESRSPHLTEFVQRGPYGIMLNFRDEDDTLGKTRGYMYKIVINYFNETETLSAKQVEVLDRFAMLSNALLEGEETKAFPTREEERVILDEIKISAETRRELWEDIDAARKEAPPCNEENISSCKTQRKELSEAAYAAVDAYYQKWAPYLKTLGEMKHCLDEWFKLLPWSVLLKEQKEREDIKAGFKGYVAKETQRQDEVIKNMTKVGVIAMKKTWKQQIPDKPQPRPQLHVGEEKLDGSEERRKGYMEQVNQDVAVKKDLFRNPFPTSSYKPELKPKPTKDHRSKGTYFPPVDPQRVYATGDLPAAHQIQLKVHTYINLTTFCTHARTPDFCICTETSMALPHVPHGNRNGEVRFKEECAPVLAAYKKRAEMERAVGRRILPVIFD